MQQFSIQLTTAQLTSAIAQAAAQGITIDPVSGATGTLPEMEGVELSYSLEETQPDQWEVFFTVLEKPGIDPVWLIAGKVKKMLGIA